MEPPARRRRYGGLLFLLLVALAAWALLSGALRIPDPWNPWAPLRIDDTPNLLTRFKLDRASADRAACRAALAQAQLRATAMEDRRTGEGCGFENALRIERTSVAVGEPFALSCRAALSLAMWERHALQQAAQAHLGRRVVAIEHFGSYACRNLYGREDGRRSRHATADAFDIGGFVLEDGGRVRVLADWAPATADDGATDAEAAFLRELRDGACRHFDAVLGPDYNAAHADHFHFDRGRARVCR
ncbi:extensin family protein [Luteimonas marina]|uniref:Extensin family protein n=1 Tax=Luteimonas marina TaxID=488485 RepID=A0A5C5UCA5_9GAMM|nr:extensin family protein [Luteimonas marina]TWT23576.1 extensin family protein [Luteimonas marina]